MLKNVLKHIFIVGQLLGYIMIMIALWRFRKTLKDHRKTSSNDFLSRSEKSIQNRSITILIIGISIIFITLIIQFILIFIMGK